MLLVKEGLLLDMLILLGKSFGLGLIVLLLIMCKINF